MMLQKPAALVVGLRSSFEWPQFVNGFGIQGRTSQNLIPSLTPKLA